jgi:3-oxoacyl-[acyl-carrier-protein] synthase III
MIGARILGTGSFLAGRRVPTEEVARQASPGKDPTGVEQKIGIATRYWVDSKTTAAEIGAEALQRAIDASGLAKTDLRRVIFVSSTGGDMLIPGTAHMVCDRLGLHDTCDAFDINNSCAGFLTALDTAARSVATGMGPVAIVSGEIFSRYLPVEKPRPYLVMGDAAAAAIVGPTSDNEGMLASFLASSAELRREVTMQHPGLSAPPTFLQFDATYEKLTNVAVDALATSSAKALAAAGLDLQDIEWFLPHQPNGRMLEKILAIMKISPERTITVVEEIGSVGSASVPVSLDRLMRSGKVRPGDRILMAAVGAGTGYGAVLFQVGAR